MATQIHFLYLFLFLPLIEAIDFASVSSTHILASASFTGLDMKGPPFLQGPFACKPLVTRKCAKPFRVPGERDTHGIGAGRELPTAVQCGDDVREDDPIIGSSFDPSMFGVRNAEGVSRGDQDGYSRRFQFYSCVDHITDIERSYGSAVNGAYYGHTNRYARRPTTPPPKHRSIYYDPNPKPTPTPSLLSPNFAGCNDQSVARGPIVCLETRYIQKKYSKYDNDNNHEGDGSESGDNSKDNRKSKRKEKHTRKQQQQQQQQQRPRGRRLLPSSSTSGNNILYGLGELKNGTDEEYDDDDVSCICFQRKDTMGLSSTVSAQGARNTLSEEFPLDHDYPTTSRVYSGNPADYYDHDYVDPGEKIEPS